MEKAEEKAKRFGREGGGEPGREEVGEQEKSAKYGVKGGKLQQNSTNPLRLHVEPLIFRRSTTSLDMPLINGKVTQKIAKEENRCKYIGIWRVLGA